ncbi:ATP-binding cassette domain-containing protein [Microbacterium petrolearium]
MSDNATHPDPIRRTSAPLLWARDVCFAYDGADVVHAVSLELPRGAVTALCGANGSGKSTLVELLAGVKRPRAGAIERGGTLALVVQRPPTSSSSTSPPRASTPPAATACGPRWPRRRPGERRCCASRMTTTRSPRPTASSGSTAG